MVNYLNTDENSSGPTKFENITDLTLMLDRREIPCGYGLEIVLNDGLVQVKYSGDDSGATWGLIEAAYNTETSNHCGYSVWDLSIAVREDLKGRGVASHLLNTLDNIFAFQSRMPTALWAEIVARGNEKLSLKHLLSKNNFTNQGGDNFRKLYNFE
jgi:hypothetical protein